MKNFLNLFAILLASYVCKAQTQYLNDPSFETGPNSIIWNDTNSVDNSGSIVSGGNNFCHSGNKCMSMVVPPVADFSGGAIQFFTVINPAHLYNAKLEFYMKCGISSGSSNDLFQIAINGRLDKGFITSGLKSDSAKIGPSWKKISVNIDTLNLGANVVQILYGNNLLISAPSTEYCVYYLDDITLTSGSPTATTNVTKPNAINIYPTIVKDKIVIENIIEPNSTATIYNLMGQEMQKNNLNNAQTQSIVSNAIIQGTYFLQIKNKTGQIMNTTKFIKL